MKAADHGREVRTLEKGARATGPAGILPPVVRRPLQGFLHFWSAVLVDDLGLSAREPEVIGSHDSSLRTLEPMVIHKNRLSRGVRSGRRPAIQDVHRATLHRYLGMVQFLNQTAGRSPKPGAYRKVAWDSRKGLIFPLTS